MRNKLLKRRHIHVVHDVAMIQTRLGGNATTILYLLANTTAEVIPRNPTAGAHDGHT